MSDQKETFEINGIEKITEISTQLVSAYVANNTVPSSELAALVKQVHSTLLELTHQANKGIGIEEPEHQSSSRKRK